MDESDAIRFTKQTEMLVSPRTVGGLYRRAEMLAKLPVGVQKWIVENAPGADPYIGFVVEPYCSSTTRSPIPRRPAGCCHLTTS
jgi:hypothetical protein